MKLTSIFLSFSLILCNNVSFAAGADQSTNPSQYLPIDISTVQIPEEIGSVQGSFKGNNDKSVILIQDAHAIFDAQNNIQELIRFLQEKYDVRMVAFEGGKGKLDPTLLRSFPDAFVKKQILKQYLEQGELTGLEMAAIFPPTSRGGSASGGNPIETKYYGIEDWKLYEENYIAYLRASQNKEAILKKLAEIKDQLDHERKQIYSAKLNEFHEHVEAFQEEKSHLLELLKYLTSVKSIENADARSSFRKAYPHLAILFDSAAKDESIQKESLDTSIRKMAESFKKKFGTRLSKKEEMEFNENYQTYFTGRMDAGGFLKFLVKLAQAQGLNPRLTPLMRELLGNAETLSMIKGTKLFDELQSFLESLEGAWITKPEERSLTQKYKRIRLLKELASLELTRDQLEQYEKAPREYLQLLDKTKDELNPALEFYRIARERDNAFHRNWVNLLKKEKAKAVIVLAGGFHANGIEKNIKKEGYSYVLITPKINSLAGQEVYSEIMQGKLSYKQYLETSFYDAFMRASSVKLFNEFNEPDFKKNLKLWRDEVIRQLSNEGRITQAGQYTRYIDLLLKAYHDRYGDSNKTPKTREQILKAIDGELKRFGEETTNNLWQRFEPQFKKFTVSLKDLIERNELTQENVSSLLDRMAKPNSSLAAPRLALTPDFPRSESRLLMNWYQKKELPSTAAESQAEPRLPISNRAGYLDALDELAGKAPASDLAGHPGIQDLSSQMNAVSKVVESGELTEETNVAEGLAPIVGNLAKNLGATPQQVVEALHRNMQESDNLPPNSITELKKNRSEVRTVDQRALEYLEKDRSFFRTNGVSVSRADGSRTQLIYDQALFGIKSEQIRLREDGNGLEFYVRETKPAPVVSSTESASREASEAFFRKGPSKESKIRALKEAVGNLLSETSLKRFDGMMVSFRELIQRMGIDVKKVTMNSKPVEIMLAEHRKQVIADQPSRPPKPVVSSSVVSTASPSGKRIPEPLAEREKKAFATLTNRDEVASYVYGSTPGGFYWSLVNSEKYTDEMLKNELGQAYKARAIRRESGWGSAGSHNTSKLLGLEVSNDSDFPNLTYGLRNYLNEILSKQRKKDVVQPLLFSYVARQEEAAERVIAVTLLMPMLTDEFGRRGNIFVHSLFLTESKFKEIKDILEENPSFIWKVIEFWSPALLKEHHLDRLSAAIKTKVTLESLETQFRPKIVGKNQAIEFGIDQGVISYGYKSSHELSVEEAIKTDDTKLEFIDEWFQRASTETVEALSTTRSREVVLSIRNKLKSSPRSEARRIEDQIKLDAPAGGFKNIVIETFQVTSRGMGNIAIAMKLRDALLEAYPGIKVMIVMDHRDNNRETIPKAMRDKLLAEDALRDDDTQVVWSDYDLHIRAAAAIDGELKIVNNKEGQKVIQAYHDEYPVRDVKNQIIYSASSTAGGEGLNAEFQEAKDGDHKIYYIPMNFEEGLVPVDKEAREAALQQEKTSTETLNKEREALLSDAKIKMGESLNATLNRHWAFSYFQNSGVFLNYVEAIKEAAAAGKEAVDIYAVPGGVINRDPDMRDWIKEELQKQGIEVFDHQEDQEGPIDASKLEEKGKGTVRVFLLPNQTQENFRHWMLSTGLPDPSGKGMNRRYPSLITGDNSFLEALSAGIPVVHDWYNGDPNTYIAGLVEKMQVMPGFVNWMNQFTPESWKNWGLLWQPHSAADIQRMQQETQDDFMKRAQKLIDEKVKAESLERQKLIREIAAREYKRLVREFSEAPDTAVFFGKMRDALPQIDIANAIVGAMQKTSKSEIRSAPTAARSEVRGRKGQLREFFEPIVRRQAGKQEGVVKKRLTQVVNFLFGIQGRDYTEQDLMDAFSKAQLNKKGIGWAQTVEFLSRFLKIARGQSSPPVTQTSAERGPTQPHPIAGQQLPKQTKTPEVARPSIIGKGIEGDEKVVPPPLHVGYKLEKGMPSPGEVIVKAADLQANDTVFTVVNKLNAVISRLLALRSVPQSGQVTIFAATAPNDEVSFAYSHRDGRTGEERAPIHDSKRITQVLDQILAATEQVPAPAQPVKRETGTARTDYSGHRVFGFYGLHDTRVSRILQVFKRHLDAILRIVPRYPDGTPKVILLREAGASSINLQMVEPEFPKFYPNLRLVPFPTLLEQHSSELANTVDQVFGPLQQRFRSMPRQQKPAFYQMSRAPLAALAQQSGIAAFELGLTEIALRKGLEMESELVRGESWVAWYRYHHFYQKALGAFSEKNRNAFLQAASQAAHDLAKAAVLRDQALPHLIRELLARDPEVIVIFIRGLGHYANFDFLNEFASWSEILTAAPYRGDQVIHVYRQDPAQPIPDELAVSFLWRVWLEGLASPQNVEEQETLERTLEKAFRKIEESGGALQMVDRILKSAPAKVENYDFLEQLRNLGVLDQQDLNTLYRQVMAERRSELRLPQPEPVDSPSVRHEQWKLVGVEQEFPQYTALLRLLQQEGTLQDWEARDARNPPSSFVSLPSFVAAPQAQSPPPRSEVREIPREAIGDSFSLLPNAPQIVSQIRGKGGLDNAIKAWEQGAKKNLNENVRLHVLGKIEQVLKENSGKPTEDFLNWIFSMEFENAIRDSLRTSWIGRMLSPTDELAFVWRIRGTVTGEAVSAIEAVDFGLAAMAKGIDKAAISAFQSRLEAAIAALKQTNEKFTVVIDDPEAEIVKDVLKKFTGLIDRLVVLHDKTQRLNRSELGDFLISSKMVDSEDRKSVIQNLLVEGEEFNQEPIFAFTAGTWPPELVQNLIAIFADIRKIPDPTLQNQALTASFILLFELARLPKEQRSELRTAERLKNFMEQNPRLHSFANGFGVTSNGTVGLFPASFLSDVAATRQAQRSA